MERARLQISVSALLGLVACIAFNLWLFRFGPLMGFIGLNITKHVIIAYLCQILGVDRRKKPQPSRPVAPLPAQVPVS